MEITGEKSTTPLSISRTMELALERREGEGDGGLRSVLIIFFLLYGSCAGIFVVGIVDIVLLVDIVVEVEGEMGMVGREMAVVVVEGGC